LDRYLQGEDGAETALVARLIYVPTGTIEWIGAAERHTRNGVHPLDLGREPAAEQLVKHTLRDLFDDFRYLRPDDQSRVESVRLLRGNLAFRQPCERIVVLPFGNESELHHAGGIVANQILSALDHAGYRVIEPGKTREAMLATGDVSSGRATAELLQYFRENLNVGLVLTGTVSEFQCGSPLSIEQIPSVAVEARLIDVLSGQVVWAKSFRSDGNDSGFLFGTGISYSAADVAGRVAARLIKAIPAYRSRRT